MNRAALEHILRAAAAISDERELIVIGRQAVLVRERMADVGVLRERLAMLSPSKDLADRLEHRLSVATSSGSDVP